MGVSHFSVGTHHTWGNTALIVRKVCRCLQNAIVCIVMVSQAPALAQRAGENAVAEAEDAFGTVVGDEEIGLYSSSSARGFNPSQAGNLRINGLYFDQAAAPNVRVRRGSTIHVGISAQGYPLPAPTGVVDFNLRVPGDRMVTSVVATQGALFSYWRHNIEIDTQLPVVENVLSIGAGAGFTRNVSHQFAVGDRGYNGGLIANWRPSETATIIPFGSYSKTSAVDGDRPQAFIGNNAVPVYRPDDLTSPDWLFFGFRHINYGVIGEAELPGQWKLEAGLFRSENNFYKETFKAFLLNTNEFSEGDYFIEQSPPRFTRSTSGELKLSRTFVEDVRRHTLYMTVRARDRSATFGGGDRRNFGRVTIGAFPDLPEPQFKTGETTRTSTRQITGGLAYEGVWQNVGQLSLAVQKSDYERTLTRPGAVPIEGKESPWLYNAAAAAYLSDNLAVYASYSRGFEELGTAPVNAVNRDEAVPAERTRQVDAGLLYQVSADVQFVAGVFQINKPYYALDSVNVFRDLGETRHRGVELSLAGDVTDDLTVVAGAVLIQPRIIQAADPQNATRLTAVGPIPRLFRMNVQYRPPAFDGLALDAKVERIAPQFVTVSNSHKTSGSVTVDAGVRYTTTIADVPVRFRLQGRNLFNEHNVTPRVSGQILPFERRRVELSLAADF